MDTTVDDEVGMTQQDGQGGGGLGGPSDTQYANLVDREEWERLAYTASVRFAPHVQAAAAEVREAEQHLATVRADLAQAREDEASDHYQADRLVFMRASVHDEVEALTRKTTPKKVKGAYRFLLARAVELAEAEVAGYQSDLAAADRERTHSVQACLEAERLACDRLEAARAMQERVHAAEQAVTDGLATMVEKLSHVDPHTAD